MNAIDMRRFHARTTELRAAVFGDRYHTLLRDDVAASEVARKLRRFDDRELAWMPHLSEVNRMLICAHLDCDEHVLDLAQRYETQRRIAYPSELAVGIGPDVRPAQREGSQQGPRLANQPRPSIPIVGNEADVRPCRAQQAIHAARAPNPEITAVCPPVSGDKAAEPSAHQRSAADLSGDAA